MRKGDGGAPGRGQCTDSQPQQPRSKVRCADKSKPAPAPCSSQQRTYMTFCWKQQQLQQSPPQLGTMTLALQHLRGVVCEGGSVHPGECSCQGR